MFTSTREFHDYRHRWIAEVESQLKYSQAELKPHVPLMFTTDLDGEFNGKRGVPFPFGTCLYYHRNVISTGNLIGFVKIIVPHIASVFVALDDLQAIATGGGSLTKTIQLDLLPNFQFGNQNFSFEVSTRARDIPRGSEVTTRIELRDMSRNDALVAVSTGVFVKTEAVTAMLSAQILQDMDHLWRSVAPLRIAGTGPRDANMNFVLRMPRPELRELPSWWEDAKQPREYEGRRANFPGRMEIYNVERSGPPGDDGVRAVVLSLRTAEGAPSLTHGGASTGGSIEVLEQLIPTLQVERIAVRFRKPIPVETKFVVEWTRVKAASREEAGDWTAKLYDWDRVLLHEITLWEKRNVRL